ncbi:hypothetical protein DsansV1_C14g0129841 [Dioscorea sansibarensis]
MTIKRITVSVNSSSLFSNRVKSFMTITSSCIWSAVLKQTQEGCLKCCSHWLFLQQVHWFNM